MEELSDPGYNTSVAALDYQTRRYRPLLVNTATNEGPDVWPVPVDCDDPRQAPAELRRFQPDVREGDIGPMFVLEAFGTSVELRIRPDASVFVHAETGGPYDPARPPLVVSVNNGPETAYGGEAFDSKGLLECGFCGGPAVWNPEHVRYEHATGGERVLPHVAGDEVCAWHNDAGTPVNPADLVASVSTCRRFLNQNQIR